jgi:hypothetical protein
MKHHKLTYSHRSVLCSIAFLVSVHVAYAEDRTPQIFAAIRESDRVAQLIPASGPMTPAGFAATFIERREPVLGLREDVVMNNGEFAWSHNWCVLRLTCSYDRDPVFMDAETPAQQRGDKEAASKRIVWRTVEMYGVSSQQKCELVNIHQAYTVDPRGGIITNRTAHLQLTRFPNGQGSSIYLFRQFIQATGRGFSEELTELTDEKTSDSGVEVRGKGRSASLAGRWTLKWENAGDLLIRQAQFFPDVNPETPDLEVSNSGVVRCAGLSLARNGDLRVGALRTHFEVLSLKPLASPDPNECELYREVLQRLTAPLPKGSQVIDRRGETLKIIDVE